ncbi:MAG TPA: hypothetical protein VLN59_14690 [Burkholderiales bacterium]|nr:hypothetical protein [Burkholderiales bacterium]
MIRKVPVRNVASDEDYVMEGELNDFLPNDNTVLVDPRSGRTYDSTDKVQLEQLPSTGLVELPRTHWGKDA